MQDNHYRHVVFLGEDGYLLDYSGIQGYSNYQQKQQRTAARTVNITLVLLNMYTFFFTLHYHAQSCGSIGVLVFIQIT